MADALARSAHVSMKHGGRGPAEAAGSGRTLVADLLALRELQASLALEESDQAVVRVGTNAIVEILTLDGGITFIDAFAGRPELRFGWRQGRAMPQDEIESLARALERELQDVRAGRCASLLLGRSQQASAPATPVPSSVRVLGFASVLVLGLGSGGRRTGVLVLASRDEEAFNGEDTILAEILASQMADQCQRVRLALEAEAETDRMKAAVTAETSSLRKHNLELEAQAAIGSAALMSGDGEHQMESALRKAMELTGHGAGAIYLVETNESGDDVLRFAHGAGVEAWMETARLPRWRRGEGLAGRVWESGAGEAFADLNDDPAGFDREVLSRAGQRRMCCEPLRARGKTIGVLQLFAGEPKPYDASLRSLLRAIAEQVGQAIHQARILADVMRHGLDLEWQVERLGREKEAALRMARGIQDILNQACAESALSESAAEILRRVVDLLGGDAASLLSITPAPAGGSLGLSLVAQHGFPEEIAAALARLGIDDPVMSRALRGEEAQVVDLADATLLQSAPWARRAGCRNLVVLPCHAGGIVRGILIVAHRYTGGPGDEILATLGACATLAGLVLAAGRSAAPRPETEPAIAATPAAPPRDLLVQAQKMESFGSLAPGIAHEFNNNLGAIMGHASHIRSLVPDHNPVHGKAMVIEEQSQKVADLVHQILTFSRGGVGRKEPIVLGPLVEETMALLTRTLGPAFEIEARGTSDLPPVLADSGQIRQVLLNLAVNARDAMPTGGRVVFEARSGHLDERALASMPGLPPGDYVSLVASDSGAGMSPDVLEHAFEPFFTTKPVTQGSGLGLTAVQDIVRGHGGQVTLSSAPGVGTAVRIYLPVCRTAPAAETKPPEPEPAAPAEAVDTDTDPKGEAGATERTEPWLRTRPLDAQGASQRILVVDDEPVLRDMTAEMLKSRGYEILVAKDGVEALEIYRKEWGRIGLVMLDMVMPRLGGLETFRRLYGMDRQARILLCSGNSHSPQAQQAIKEGAIGLLPKPFGMAELLGWVERGLR